MSRMSWPAPPGPERSALLLAAPGRDAAVATVAVLLTVGVFAAVGDHGTLTSIRRLDDAWLRLMISGQAPPLTAIARVFNILGLVYVTLPIRLAVAGFSRCDSPAPTWEPTGCRTPSPESCSGSRAPS